MEIMEYPRFEGTPEERLESMEKFIRYMVDIINYNFERIEVNKNGEEKK